MPAVALPRYQNYQLRLSAETALFEARAAESRVEAQIREIGSFLESSLPVIEPDALTNEPIITATRTLAGKEMYVTLRRSTVGEWSCQHTFEINLDDCTKKSAESVSKESEQ